MGLSKAPWSMKTAMVWVSGRPEPNARAEDFRGVSGYSDSNSVSVEQLAIGATGEGSEVIRATGSPELCGFAYDFIHPNTRSCPAGRRVAGRGVR